MPTPFHGERFTFTQPDGTELEVKGWGNQFSAHFETLDGFAVVRNPDTGFYEYGLPNPASAEMLPSGFGIDSIDPLSAGLPTSAATMRMRSATRRGRNNPLGDGPMRWEQRRSSRRAAQTAASFALGPSPAPPQSHTVGTYIGLCLLIDFPDVPGSIGRDEVERYCNEVGYSGFGNNGSVYDYFLESSGGRLKYTNIVAVYHTAKHPRSYYTNPKVSYGKRTRELIGEALATLKSSGVGLDALSTDAGGYVYALNVFYAGRAVNQWSEGLWPHAHHLGAPFQLAPGKLIFDYQITNVGDELTLGTFCHENGHMICDFPDLYDYDGDSRGVGNFCLMCGGANADPKNPTHVGAYLKYKAGWASKVTPLVAGLVGEASRDERHFFIHRKSPTEYFLLENRGREGRDSALPGEGLAIWHVDELGDNNNQHATPHSHYECSLIQADGLQELESNMDDGDAGDLFHAGGNRYFSDSTTPDSRWWDGTSSGLTVRNIGPIGQTITFST